MERESPGPSGVRSGSPLGWRGPDGSGHGSGGGPRSWEWQGPRSKNPSAAQRPWVLLSGAAGSRSIGASGAVGAVGGVAGGPRTLLSWRGCQVGSLACGWERTPCAHSGASEVTSPVWSRAAACQPRRAACPLRREWPGHRGWRDRPDWDRRRPALRPTRHSGRARLSVVPWPAAGARFVPSRGAAGHRWSRGPWGGPRYLVDLQGAFLEAQGRTQLDIK